MSKKVVVLGAGMVSRPLVHYLLNKGYQVKVGDQNEAQARDIVRGFANGKPFFVDGSRLSSVRPNLVDANLVVSLLPPFLHFQIAELCLELGLNFLTASYLSPEIRALDQDAKAKGLIFLNEIGVDPGIDHLTAMELIQECKDNNYRILSFDSHCGGIPSRKAANNPLRYKLSWSPRGVLGAITRPSKYLRDGQLIQVPGENKLDHAEIISVPGAGIFESNPNADSLHYGECYGLTDALTVRRGTLRYPGWAQFWLFMLSLDFLNQETELEFQNEQALAALFTLTGRQMPEDIFDFVIRRAGRAQASLFLEMMDNLGLLDCKNRVNGRYTCFELLLECAQAKLNYAPGELDWVVLHHEFLVEKGGQKEKWTSTLVREGEQGGPTAMAFLVGVPAAIAARLILEDKIKQRGVLIPLAKEFYQPILAELSDLGLPHQITKQTL